MNKYIELVKSVLKPKRFEHTLEVSMMAVQLAEAHDVSLHDAELAGILHDYAKCFTEDELIYVANKHDLMTPFFKHSPSLLHGEVAAIELKGMYPDLNDDILNAIRYHTYGRENMTALEKVIYLADAIEPRRKYQGVDLIRDLAFENLDRALLLAVDHSINYVLMKRDPIHVNSVLLRNELINNLEAVK